MFGRSKRKENLPAEEGPEQRLAAAEAKVAECERLLKQHDNSIANWAADHGLHFDGDGAVASWHPDRVAEFKELNKKRNEAWHQFQGSLSEFARAKEETQVPA